MNTQFADDMLRAIRQIVRRISEHSRHLSRSVGLTVPQLVCLKAIDELQAAAPPDATVATLSAKVELAPATVSRIIDRLVRAGLVSRVRQPGDRRKVCITLTATGKERLESVPMPLQEQFIQRLATLPPSECAALLEALRRISQLMDATELDVAPMLAPGAEVNGEPADE